MAEPAELLTAWPSVDVRSVRRIDVGTNNLTYVVESAQGAYVLRRYRNTELGRQLQDEHRLLRQLAEQDLPFAVPCPLPTANGRTYATHADRAGTALVALFPYLSGRPPNRKRLADVRACAAALAVLDAALAALDTGPAPDDGSAAPAPSWGDLASVHPLVPDPLAAVRRVPADAGAVGAAVAAIERVNAQAPPLLDRLECQLLHSDYFPSNVLMEHDQVSAVLDFEFAAPGPRVLDLAIGLSAFGHVGEEDGAHWAVLEEFGRAYQRVLPLAVEELAAVPVLLLLREATSLVHWMGRRRRGLTTDADLAGRVRRLAAVSAWADAHGDRLVAQLQTGR